MKNKMIICTVGTSISNGCPSQRELLSKPSKWEDDVKSFEKEIAKRIENIDASSFRMVSAEINSIDRLCISSNDKIVLLSSDNAPGKACCHALKQVIINSYNLPEENVIIERIEGLQVYNSAILKKVGLKNFITAALKYLDDKSLSYQYDVIINPTGGFKGVLPFLTILGMMYGKKTVYIFEFAEELIYLPPLPFTFDLNIFDRVRPALEYIEEKVAVTEHEFLSKIKNYTESERELFLAFVEPFDDKLTISSLSFCFLSAEKRSKKAKVLVDVVSELDADRTQPGLALKRLISKVSSPLWRNNHSESWHTSNLIVIKQSRTAERLAGFIKNDTFHVTHAFRTHDEYEAKLKGCSAEDYYKLSFVEWAPSENMGSAEADDQNGLVAERDDLLLQLQELKTKASAFEEDAKLLRIEVGDREADCAIARDEILKATQESEELKRKITELEQNKDLLSVTHVKLKRKNKDLVKKLSDLENHNSDSFLGRIKRIFKGHK